jgi:signal transduction histidine kinase
MKQRIRLTSEITDCPEKILADERKMSKIIYNLLSNAIKFTADGGSVHLSVRQLIRNNDNWVTTKGEIASISFRHNFDGPNHNRLVQITVADTGIGLNQDDRERIFNPFVQADGSISRRYQGTGLGLYMTKRFVEMHQGIIWAESDGEGKGSTFHVVVPV